MVGTVVTDEVKDGDVVDGAGYDDGHDGDPHAVHHVALDRAVDEYTVADQLVVVEVAADDRRAQVNDDASDVDDGDAEQDAADARTSLDTHVMFTAHVQVYTRCSLLNKGRCPFLLDPETNLQALRMLLFLGLLLLDFQSAKAFSFDYRYY